MVCLLFITNIFILLFSLIENFIQANPSGRLSYGSIPEVLQRFGIVLTEDDIVSAAKELEYNGKISFFLSVIHIQFLFYFSKRTNISSTSCPSSGQIR